MRIPLTELGLNVGRKEIMEYPEGDIHFLIKHGEEIEKCRGYNQRAKEDERLCLEIKIENFAIELCSRYSTAWDRATNQTKTHWRKEARSIFRNLKQFARVVKG